jgi:hypothetical protein
VPDLELDVTAQLCASLDGLTAQMRRAEERHQRMAQAIRQVPLAAGRMNLTTGVLDDPAQLRAPTGFIWGVRRLTLSGFATGTAIVYLNAAGGEPVAPFSQAGTFTFGRGELLLHPGDRLVVTATGQTGSDYVQLNGAADAFELWFLPYYIG